MKLEPRNWCIASIDPGAKPTLCIQWDRGAQIRFFEESDVSEVVSKGGGAVRWSASPTKLEEILRYHRCHAIAIERVWVRPDQGIVSQAKLVYSHATCVAVARTCGIPAVLEVFPQTWMRYHGLLGKQDKRFHRMRAGQIEPNVLEFVTRTKDHDRADAFLIGKFCEAFQDKTYAYGVTTKGEALDYVPRYHVTR